MYVGKNEPINKIMAPKQMLLTPEFFDTTTYRNYIIIDCCWWHPPCQQTNAEVCSRCFIFSDQSQEVMKILHLYFWALQRTDHSLEYDRPCKKFACFATPSSKTREPNWIWPLVMKLNCSKALIIIIVNHILDPSRVAHIQRVLTAGNLGFLMIAE